MKRASAQGSGAQGRLETPRSRGPLIGATLVLGLGACIGAALARTAPDRQQEPAAANSSARPEEGPPIDRSAVLPLAAVRAPQEIGMKAFEHVRALTGFGPRHPGSPGWSRQLDYIERTLTDLGLEVRRDTWTDRRELITFTNLAATIPGRRSERIVLACHHDTKCMQGHADPQRNFHFVGANDGASGVALLLALAPVLQRGEREASIDLVFFDGEESLDWHWNDAARALFGSRRFVARHREALLLGEEPRIAALILLDMVGREPLHIQEELYSTARLRTIAWSAAVATGHREHFFTRAEAASDDHQPFLQAGIPSIDLIDLNGNPHWHKATDTIENMSAASLQKVADVVLTMLPEVEQVYVVRKE